MRIRHSGFSLIELMVVVAIIGVLAAIAVPNFQRFQKKARQSEAKVQLGALYTAEKAFFAEWNQYFADFRDIGFHPNGVLNYNVGWGTGPGIATPAEYSFPGTGGQGACNGMAGACNAQIIECRLYCGGFGAWAGGSCTQGSFFPTIGVGPGYVAPTATTFIAGAAARVRPGDPIGLDVWHIDELKNLRNIQSDP